MNRCSEEHKLWLFDLSHNPDMPDLKIVKGFIQFYALEGLTVDHVQQDIAFRTAYGAERCKLAMERLKESLNQFAVNDL